MDKSGHPKVQPPSHYLKEYRGIEAVNRWLAVKLGNVLGSMYFFYFCVLLDLVELPAVIHTHSLVLWVGYVSQIVIQLIALPIIGAQNKIQREQDDAKAAADHTALTHIATVVDDIYQVVVPGGSALKDIETAQTPLTPADMVNVPVTVPVAATPLAADPTAPDWGTHIIG